MVDRATILSYVHRYAPYVILFGVYYVVGRIGLAIHPVNTFATLVWPPTAVALSALILRGYYLWPAITLGAFAVNLSVGANVFTAAGIAFGNTLEAVAGAYVLNQYVGFRPNLARLRDNIGLIATAFCVPVISATVGVSSVWLGNQITHEGVLPSWLAWWSGDALSVLVLAPFLLKWFSKSSFIRTTQQYTELALSNAVVFAVSLIVFCTPGNPFSYYIFLPLTWVAFRSGPRGTSLAILLASSVAITGTLFGLGPYAHTGLLPLGIFIATISILFLIFTSIMEERKDAVQELGQHVHELEDALRKISSEDEAKKNFLAILAHELRNPLAAMLSSVEVLQLAGTTATQSSKLLQTIYEHVHTMRIMLDDVLDMTRVSRNKLVLKKESVPLDAVIDRSIESVQPLIRNRRHTLIITRSSTPLYVEGDPVRLEQILVNILNNAAKYTNQYGRIQITVQREGPMAMVSVRDNGIGIPKTMQKKIFEPFFQVKRGQLATEGLGVGLPLTHQLVEMHGGTIEAKSDGEGTGSEFIVNLPLAAQEYVPTLTQRPPGVSPALQKRRPRPVKNARAILVVDDNEAAAQSLAKLLELRGHTVTIAYTGLDAVDKARQQRPDIVVLDIGLPDIDGYEVARTLRSDASFPSAIIALTGYGQEDDKARAYEAGFHHHLTKPVGLKELEKAFKKVSAL
jgi:signal transduction histidine kinase/CheY-like chemotaxis protein